MQALGRYGAALARRRQRVSILALIRASRLRRDIIRCDGPMFVVASPRSGTTALCRALNEHPGVLMAWGGAPSLQWIGGLAHAYQLGPTCYHYQRYTGLLSEHFSKRLRRLAFDCVWADPFRLLRSGENIFPHKYMGRRCPPGIWGCLAAADEPAARGLGWLFPNVKFVYMVRNGMEVVYSMSRFVSFRDRSFERLCHDWAGYVSRYEYLRAWDKTLCVRFEEFRDDPKATLAKVCCHIGISLEVSTIRFAQSVLVHPLDGPTVYADPRFVLKSRPPVHEQWSDAQREIFRRICGKGMELLGYDLPY